VRTRTQQLLAGFGLPVAISLPPVEEVIVAAAKDKKVVTGTSGFVGLASIGGPVWGLDISPAQLAKGLEVIRS
jgi:3-dehydroquinate synthetase